MFTAKADRPYFDAWLRRTRKQFAVSGRLTQTAHILSKEEGGGIELWTNRLRGFLDETETPSLELLTRIDSILAPSSPPTIDPESQDNLL